MHQALGFGKFGEGLGEITAPPFEIGDHTMPDEHADIAAGARFAQAGTQASKASVRLITHQQQVTFVQR